MDKGQVAAALENGHLLEVVDVPVGPLPHLGLIPSFA